MYNVYTLLHSQQTILSTLYCQLGLILVLLILNSDLDCSFYCLYGITVFFAAFLFWGGNEIATNKKHNKIPNIKTNSTKTTR